MKGCPLACYKTGKAGTRISNDIDILIPRQDILKVEKILEDNDFHSDQKLNRKERIMLISNSHQMPPYSKRIGSLYSQIDVNFDLFWGEYNGKRIDVAEFISDAVEMEIYGCKIKTLSPLKTMIQIILHHYKEMNSLYHLMGPSGRSQYIFAVECKVMYSTISRGNSFSEEINQVQQEELSDQISRTRVHLLI